MKARQLITNLTSGSVISTVKNPKREEEKREALKHCLGGPGLSALREHHWQRGLERSEEANLMDIWGGAEGGPSKSKCPEVGTCLLVFGDHSGAHCG